MAKPRATVILVTHNDQEFITATLESILRQTYHNIEVVVCDQASTDETYSILTSFGDDRLRISESAEDNYFACVNEAVRLARGDFILEFPSNGIMKPTAIESLLAVIEREADVVCATAQFVQVDANGLITGRPRIPVPGNEMALELLLSDELVHAPLLLRRKSAGETLYNVHCKQPKLEFLWSANQKGKVITTKEYLVGVRSTKTSDLGLWSRRYAVFNNLWRFPGTIQNLSQEQRDVYGTAVVRLYKTALRKRDYVFGLIVLVCALRRPGYRHEFLRMIRRGK